MAVTFTKPPEPKGGRVESKRNMEIADLLRSKPGEWALIAEGESSDGLAVRIRSGRAKSFAQGVWESASRKNAEGTIDIYARFVE